MRDEMTNCQAGCILLAIFVFGAAMFVWAAVLPVIGLLWVLRLI